jgi:hypothetical protein
LYKGHGRRSAYFTPEAPWGARLNLSGGFHGAAYGLADDGFYAYGGPYGFQGGWYDYDFWRMGGYAQAGLELALLNGFSMEPYGLFRRVEDTDTYAVVPAQGGYYYEARDHVEIEAWGVGMTIRRYAEPGGSSAYWGLGGGYVNSTAKRWHSEGGALVFEFEDVDEAPEAHFLVGFEARALASLSFGLEIGYRYAWLDDATDFSGVLLGARLGILMP